MKNKKYQFLICLLLSIFIFLPVLALAVDAVGGSSFFTNPLKAESITDLLADVLNIIVQIGLVVIVIFIVYAGFQFVTARGDTGKITKAREAIVNTLIGSAIILGSYAIASALKNTVESLGEGVGMSNSNLLAAGATVGSIISNVLSTIINPLSPILIGLALVVFFYGLFKYLKSGIGDTKDVDGAKSLMLWGVIILFVMFSVWGLVGILQNTFFGSSPTTTPNVPQFGID